MLLFVASNHLDEGFVDIIGHFTLWFSVTDLRRHIQGLTYRSDVVSCDFFGSAIFCKPSVYLQSGVFIAFTDIVVRHLG